MTSEPRSRRDALVAQLAGELDELLVRVERLPPRLDEANQRIEVSAVALGEALERYRSQLGTLSTQVLRSMGELAVRRSREVMVRSVEEQQALMQASARQAFEAELAPRLRALVDAAATHPPGPGTQPFWSTWLQHAATAVVAAGCSAAIVLYVVRP